MKLGFFSMPMHPIGKDWRQSLREDREAFILADGAVALGQVIDKLVMHGSPAKVADSLLAMKQETGEFGTLLSAGVDWTDRTLGRNSMTLMSEKVLPLITA